jgi:hypothetical protein
VRTVSSSPEDVVSSSMQSSILVTQTIVDFTYLPGKITSSGKPSDGQAVTHAGHQDEVKEICLGYVVASTAHRRKQRPGCGADVGLTSSGKAWHKDSWRPKINIGKSLPP